MLTDKTMIGLTEVFIMLGDHGLPERSHLLVSADIAGKDAQNDAHHPAAEERGE